MCKYQSCKKFLSLIIAICIILISSFPADSEWKSRRKRRYDCAGDLRKAVSRYQKGRFSETKTILSEAKYQCTGHEAMDSILYFLGMSMLKSKSPSDAKIEFNRLLMDFSNSQFAEEALFRVGQASYLASNPSQRAQSTTRDAIRELSEFIDRYPGSVFADSATQYIKKCENKLVEREFMAARLYEKIDKYESAILYYRVVIADYPGSEFENVARLSLGHCLARVKRIDEARAVLQELYEDDNAKDVRQKTKLLLSRLDTFEKETPRRTFIRRLFQTETGESDFVEPGPSRKPSDKNDKIKENDIISPDVESKPAESSGGNSDTVETEDVPSVPEETKEISPDDVNDTDSSQIPETR